MTWASPESAAALLSVSIVVGGFFVWIGRFKEQVVMETDCKKYRMVCQEATCKKVDEIKNLVTKMDAKREAGKDALYIELTSLSTAIARIEGAMKK